MMSVIFYVYERAHALVLFIQLYSENKFYITILIYFYSLFDTIHKV